MEPWLPIGFPLPGDGSAGKLLHAGEHWQIVAAGNGASSLLARRACAEHWLEAGFIEPGQGAWLTFGDEEIWTLTAQRGQLLWPIKTPSSPDSKTDALAFAAALKHSRAIDPTVSLHDALYVAQLGRLLPTYTGGEPVADELVLGLWLTGGARVAASDLDRLNRIMSWLPRKDVIDVVQRAGIRVALRGGDAVSALQPAHAKDTQSSAPLPFELAGREELTAFFREHVIDIVHKPEIYARLGITSPSAIVLHGPTGCGKTFAVESLVAYLGWPCFDIDANSVASPYIHETSKKVAEVFAKAIENKPSVIVIDEMDAFLARRDTVTGQHHIEEVAEFLRRIPEAISHGVLVIGMTNRIDAIDSAILRRGRFDHVIAVAPANAVEVLALMQKVTASLPVADNVDLTPLAHALAGSPLSDAAFVVREAARLAARAGHSQITQEQFQMALQSVNAHETHVVQSRPIGFV